MKLAAGGHSNHATSTRGKCLHCGGENHRTGTGVEIFAKQTETLKVDRARPAPVEFTHSKTGSDDGCNPRLNAASLYRCTAGALPPWSPDRHHASPRWPRPWQWAEIWDRSSPTLRSPPECQPLPLIINAWSFPFTPFFLVDALFPPYLLHLLPSLRREVF